MRANHALAPAAELAALPDRDPDDHCTIAHSEYAAGAGGAPVAIYTMNGGGHNLPSARYAIPDTWVVRRFIGPVCRDAEGTELAWAFLSRFRR